MVDCSKFSRRAVLFSSFAVVLGCGSSQRTDGLVAGESGRVVKIRDGDALTLDSGLSVRLAEIEAPRLAWNDRPQDPFGEQSFEMLEYIALGRVARLYYGGLSRDRYDRALAHVLVEDETGKDIWLNGYMVHQGGARVRSYSDNCARARALYPLESEARQLNRGLWTHQGYNVRTPDDLSQTRRGFCIVEGRIDEIAEIADGQSRVAGTASGGLAVRLGYGLARAPDRIPLAPGDHVRLRGYASELDGHMDIRPDHWAQFEALEL
tara:strand:- start:1114 stop:1908 length:795 start_codon:yes stop_codon:yes gene_type:complete